MKKVFSFLLIIAVLCTLTVPCFAANPTVSVKAPNAITGETITVSVNLSANSGLGALEFELQYGSEFTYVNGSAKCTELFENTTGEVPGICFVSSGTGKLKFSGANPEIVNAGGTLFTAQFKVNEIGGTISIKVLDAINGDNQNVTVSTTSATVKCSHANAKWVVTKNATCTEKGSETKECSCGDKSTREIALTSHTFGAWVITKEATETEKGAKERVCKVCSQKETASINKLAPTETVTDTETNSQKEAETETQSESQTQTETTTIPQSQDMQKTDAKPIIVGAIFFVVGIAVGIGATLVIIKRKAKEEE